MTSLQGLRNLVLVSLFAVCTTSAADGPPAWAYGFPQPGAPAPPAGTPARGAQSAPDNSPKRLAGSNLEFTLAQIRDGFGPADWFPGDHPKMPEIVAHGRRPDIRACALCHYPNGKGRAENAPIAGYPVAYFVQQMYDFKNGNRKSAEPRKANTNAMIAIAKAMTDEEIKTTAEYFGAMPWTPWIKVVEAPTVPKTRIAGGLFLALDGGEREPGGMRIIEVPESTEMTEMYRNPRSDFIAYAPPGSIKKGEELATSGGKTLACATCHGEGLKGLGPVPGLAGRSPSYLVRQMYDMQAGARKGVWTPLMTKVVASLSEEDMLNIAAYCASLKP
ncbi:MAG TPA: c-type cytochrome [Bryobacteraceae bacterium]|nr:c-type cytochrome [Bryobacteraceae bacterium]